MAFGFPRNCVKYYGPESKLDYRSPVDPRALY